MALIEMLLVAYLPQGNPSAPHLSLETGQGLSEREREIVTGNSSAHQND